MPTEGSSASTPETQFSTERARSILREISKEPHYVGSEEHARVRTYLIGQLEQVGLETQQQEGYVLNSKSGGFTKPKNIMARIKGHEEGEALLLLSHYDSAQIHSVGASDAGSGVVTILESIRAYQASGKIPRNDIIILFSDAEELGLYGASLFVNEHPWAKNIGLVLNFESRGSGGPSNMIVETNGGNENLIKAFIDAGTKYPVASSLMYSIYKMLPNDTDSTIFREDRDIDGFFFAFIDDHFDYHTANDTYENLDENTLQHQGEYLLPLLHYFADADLSILKSDKDYVYVNVPDFKMISYPFSWVNTMYLIAVIFFILVLFYGLRKRILNFRNIVRGLYPFIISLISVGVISYFGWKGLLKLYPHYNEIQHGFTYNGHSYIAFFVFLSLGVAFYIYHRFARKISSTELTITPLFFWLIINGGIALYLKGAAYFIIPFFFTLFSIVWIIHKMNKDKRPNRIVLAILTAPVLFLLAPLVQFFPIGLGLKMLVISCVFTVLIFGLLMPVLGSIRSKKTLSWLFFILAIGFLLNAHFTSDFNEIRQKPNSLVYYQDMDKDKSYWVSYDKLLDDWTRSYLGDEPEDASKFIENVSGSKYNRRYSYALQIEPKEIPEFKVRLNSDTIIDEQREVSFTIIPQRKVNQMNLYADENLSFNSFSYNGVSVTKDSTGMIYDYRESKKLVRFTITDHDSLEIRYRIQTDHDVAFTVEEYSFDLMEHPQFSMTKRSKDMMPKPFVMTDAVVLKKTIVIDSLRMESFSEMAPLETIKN
jgi:hypothetical protein